MNKILLLLLSLLLGIITVNAENLSSAQSENSWLVTEGCLSPDKRLGIAVYPQKTEHIDEADGTVLLVDMLNKKPISILKEIDSTGGNWGKTTDNISCSWHANSSLVAVNFHTGRMTSSNQLYSVKKNQLIPLSLPDPRSHLKGKILDALDLTANSGSELELKPTGDIIERRWGFLPKETLQEEDYSNYGIEGLTEIDGELLFIYKKAENHQLILVDVMPNIKTKD